MARPNYDEVDGRDKSVQIGDRNNTPEQLDVTELWMKVLHKAVDDIVTFTIKIEDGEELTKEEEYEIETANGILFDPDWRVPIDDYYVEVICSRCGHAWAMKMSVVASEEAICAKCKRKTKPKTTSYIVSDKHVVREISLEELLSIWGLENVEAFREGTRRQIEDLKIKKRSTQEKRGKTKERKKQMSKEERDPASGREFIESFKDRNASPGNEDGHYSGPIQPTDFCLMQGLGLLEHGVIKYLCRYRKKGGMLDLEKACWYLMRLIQEYSKELEAEEKQ